MSDFILLGVLMMNDEFSLRKDTIFFGNPVCSPEAQLYMYGTKQRRRSYSSRDNQNRP